MRAGRGGGEGTRPGTRHTKTKCEFPRFRVPFRLPESNYSSCCVLRAARQANDFDAVFMVGGVPSYPILHMMLGREKVTTWFPRDSRRTDQ